MAERRAAVFPHSSAGGAEVGGVRVGRLLRDLPQPARGAAPLKNPGQFVSLTDHDNAGRLDCKDWCGRHAAETKNERTSQYRFLTCTRFAKKEKTVDL